MSQVQVRDEFGRGITYLNIRLGLNAQTEDECQYDAFTDLAGNTAFPYAPKASGGYTLYANYRNVNSAYVTAAPHVANLDNDVVIVLERNPLPEIQVNGMFFNVGHIRGNTDFLLYKKFLDSVDIEPILLQRMDLGSRFVRTIGMVNSFAKWHPQDYGDNFYWSIKDFSKLLNDYGIYWYFNVFADTQEVMPNEQQQIDHYNRVCDELSKYNNIFLELVNEQGQHSNSVDRSKFNKHPNIVSSSGSFGSRIPPDPPHWDFIDYHSRRDYPGSVMEVNTADYIDNQGKTRVTLNKPIGTGEPMKFGTIDPKAIDNIRIAFEMGFSGYGVSPFNVFHSENGVMSDLFDDITFNNAHAFFNGL